MSVYTQSIENEIWDYVTDFESKHFVRQFAEKYIATTIDKNSSKDTGLNLEPIDTDYIDLIIQEVNNNTKQARDFFMMAKEISLLSRPIMLLCSLKSWQ